MIILPSGYFSSMGKVTKSVADPGFRRGVATYDLAKFLQKLHEIERIWTLRGASLAPP